MSINNSAIKRIAKDVKYIINNSGSLSSENIYYKHDEENIMKGYALIVGQGDTPYGYGYYFFEFIYPYNYPFSPPEVHYLTNDGTMRFNPNLYTNGKVCLSILNTWAGESWTACQTIYSLLLTLSSILCVNPLLNEPGIKEEHEDVDKYNYLVTYKNIEFSIIKVVNIICFNEVNNFIKDHISIMHKFKTIIIETFMSNKEKILEFIDNNRVKYEKLINLSYVDDNKNKKIYNLYISVYNLKYDLNYDKLKKLILEINIL
jgi:ubiquitin-conjugating enzyme E2 Z